MPKTLIAPDGSLRGTAPIACPLCGGWSVTRMRTIGNLDTPTHARIPRLAVAVCDDCGLAQQNPCVTPEQLDRIYQTEADKVVVSGLVHDVSETEAEARVAALRDVLPPPARILELGCSHGTFLETAHRAGYEVVGLEPSSVSIERLRARLPQVEVVRGFAEDYRPAERFDAVLHFYVLEHVFDPVALLRHMRGWLRASGVLLFEVPDLAQFPTLPFASLLFPYQHIAHFDPRTIDTALAMAGWARCRPHAPGAASKAYGMRVVAQPAEPTTSRLNHARHTHALLARHFAHRDQVIEGLRARVRGWLDALAARPGPIVVFGAGINGRIAVGECGLAESGRPLVFCDNNARLHGQRVDGLEVVAPTAVPALDPPLVVVASVDYQSDMVQQLHGLGVPVARIVRLYEGR